MIGSIGGIAIYNIGSDDNTPTGGSVDTNGIDVNGYAFYENIQDGSFEAIVTDTSGNALAVPFRADPRELSDIIIEDNAVLSIKSAERMYLVFDPNTEDFEETKNNLQLALGQVSRLINLVTVNRIHPTTALTADIPNETYDDTVPIKDCSDATETTPVLFFTIAQDDSVTIQDNCIIISGTTGDRLIDVGDKLGMHLVGLKV